MFSIKATKRKLNKRALLKLADLLEKDAKNKKGVKFDLSVLVSAECLPNRDNIFAPTKYEKIGVDCGTRACAMGLAAISGAFKRHGLTFRQNHGDIKTILNGRSVGWHTAAEKVFGLRQHEVNWLFLDESYKTPPTGAGGEREVARRIRNFVAGKEGPVIKDDNDNIIYGLVS